jgi:DNA-binding response OmpR family regulator
MKILYVEDDPTAREYIQKGLTEQGFVVDIAADGEQGLERALAGAYDLVILDIMLPKKDGFDVCRELRKAGVRTPILLLTARTHEAEIIQGLDLGADDYITKPFSARELRARIRARLRSERQPDEDVLRCADLEIDTARVEVRKGGEKAEVTPQEFKLMVTFARNPGRVLSRDQLIDLAWGGDTFVTDRAVDAHIVNLRRKLGPELIASVRGMGYRFDG